MTKATGKFYVRRALGRCNSAFKEAQLEPHSNVGRAIKQISLAVRLIEERPTSRERFDTLTREFERGISTLQMMGYIPSDDWVF